MTQSPLSSFGCDVVSPIPFSSLEDVVRLEKESFPPDEAASIEKITLRRNEAGEYFSGCYSTTNNELVGFINGTCSTNYRVTHESMSCHEPNGKYLVIHSITIKESWRRKGLGSSFLLYYINDILLFKENIDSVILICKANLIEMYSKCGFQMIGLSNVQHGKDQWFEMKIDLKKLRNVQFQIDAFTDKVFSGNPAAVVFRHGTEEWMQSLANENNLAETVFLAVQLPDEVNRYKYKIRWFTPTKEVEICGHATLASVHALYESGRVPRYSSILFETHFNAKLLAKENPETKGQSTGPNTIELSFPAIPPSLYCGSDVDNYKQLVQEAFHLKDPKDIIHVGKSRLHFVIEISVEAFASLNVIDYNILKKFDCMGVLLTCLGPKHFDSTQALLHQQFDKDNKLKSRLQNSQIDFFSRNFFPRFGIDEDPVTGSAHCALGPYWHKKLNLKLSDTMIAMQASERGGIIQVTLTGNDENSLVILGGTCVTALETNMLC